MFDFVLLDEGSVTLPAQTTMLLVTDGVTGDEFDHEREQFGTERIEALLLAEMNQDAQTVCDVFLRRPLPNFVATRSSTTTLHSSPFTPGRRPPLIRYYIWRFKRT